MAKPHVHYPGAVYHVTARGVRRTPVFLDDSDCEAFLRMLERAARRFRFQLLSFCLMVNHFHLIIEVSDISLSRIMQAIMTAYAIRYNRRTGSQGHVFDKRFFRRLIRTDGYLTHAIRYVHGNPVTAGLVKQTADWRWSSASQFRQGSDGLANLSRVRELLGDDAVIPDLVQPSARMPFEAYIPEASAPCFDEEPAPEPDLMPIFLKVVAGTEFTLGDLRGPARHAPLPALRKEFFRKAVLAGAKNVTAGRFLNRPGSRVSEAIKREA